MRIRKGIILLLLGASALIACRSASPTPTVVPSPTTVPTEVAPAPTPVETPAPVVLKPPDLVLKAGSGEQPATIGPFFWVLDSGFAGETTAPGLVPTSEQPLAVRPGETLSFAFSEDRIPEKVSLAVYPQEGNYEPISPAPDAPKGFVATTDPVVTAEPELSGAGFQWTMPELSPGAYFLRVEVEWPQHPKNPRPDKVPRAVYAFWIRVS